MFFITVEQLLDLLTAQTGRGGNNMLTAFGISFVILLAIGIPISIALGGSAMTYVLLQEDLSLTMLIQTTFAGMSSFPLLAIPLFMLAGNFMNEGGLTRDLVAFCQAGAGSISVAVWDWPQFWLAQSSPPFPALLSQQRWRLAW